MRVLVPVAAAGLVLASSVIVQGQGMVDRIRDAVARFDANKDGVIEKDEVPEQGREMFGRMLNIADTNKNGRIDADEVPKLLAAARNQDQAKKKAGNQTEAVAQMLKQMDKDGDGKVSRAEFTSYPEYFDRLDANKDGFLVATEIGQGQGNLLNKNLPFLPPPRATTGLVPLTELKTGIYQGFDGGLYAGGTNDRPATHTEAGLKIARSIKTLDAKGNPADDGKVVLLSIGMSNTTQEFSAFMELARSEPGKNPNLVIVDGAQGGQTARPVSQPDSPQGQRFWETVDQRLEAAGVTRAQVQVAWMKQADGSPSTGFPAYAKTLEEEMEKIAQVVKDRFPNTRLLYLSSRIYGGYATTPLNPEPYAYESGFAVKWMIGKQLAGDSSLNFDPARGAVKSPWLSWGPYLWADGTKARADGLTYEKDDLGADGTHPATSGRRKVAQLLLDFFKTDPTAKVWFLAPSNPETR